MKSVKALIETYYDSFNQQDMDKFTSCLAEDVVHDINQGTSEVGKDKFIKFMKHMNDCYQETAKDIIIMISDDEKRAAAEFIIEGTYLHTDKGLPEAKGQHYRLPVGAFFNIQEGKIKRVTNYYNLQDWLDQVNK